MTTESEFSDQPGQLPTVLMADFSLVLVCKPNNEKCYITSKEQRQELLVGPQCLSYNLVT